MLISKAIDQIVARGEDVADTDADDSSRRVRAQEDLNEIWIVVWGDRPWPWKRKEKQVTVPANQGYIAVPTDFDSVGHYGGLFVAATGRRLDYMAPQEFQELKRSPGLTGGDDPGFYSLYDQEATTPFALRIQVITNTNEIVFDLSYEKVAPYLDEDDDDTDLNMISEQWQRAVIIPGAKALRKLDLGDITQAQFELQMKRGLRLMRASERPGQDTTEKLPSFLGND